MSIKEAPEPTVINWKNLNVGSCSRFIRTLFVAFVTILLLAISFAGIVVSKYFQDLVDEKYAITKCGGIQPT